MHNMSINDESYKCRFDDIVSIINDAFAGCMSNLLSHQITFLGLVSSKPTIGDQNYLQKQHKIGARQGGNNFGRRYTPF